MHVISLVVANIVANDRVVASETIVTVDKVLTEYVLELLTAGFDASMEGDSQGLFILSPPRRP